MREARSQLEALDAHSRPIDEYGGQGRGEPAGSAETRLRCARCSEHVRWMLCVAVNYSSQVWPSHADKAACITFTRHVCKRRSNDAQLALNCRLPSPQVASWQRCASPWHGGGSARTSAPRWWRGCRQRCGWPTLVAVLESIYCGKGCAIGVIGRRRVEGMEARQV